MQSPSAVEIHQRLIETAQALSPLLMDAIAQNGPLTLIPNQAIPFADHLCRVVAGQQLSLKAAQSIWNRVLTSAQNAPQSKSLINYFASVDTQALRQCGLSGAKVKTVSAIAQATQAGQLDPTELRTLTHTDCTQRLTALWGIGPWTADMMSLFYFGDPDIWPNGDVTARKTLERLTSKRRKTHLTAARFAPYRSYLALHMWHHVDATPDQGN